MSRKLEDRTTSGKCGQLNLVSGLDDPRIFALLGRRVSTCHMVTPSGHTFNLVRLCGGGQQTVALPSQKQSATEAPQPVSTPRKRLDSSKYLLQYQQLAERYPDSQVVKMLASMDKMPYAESVCKRLSTGLTVEQIRTQDIQKLQSDPSGNLTLDNARKQNIEITLKLAPQYYCPEGTP